MTIILVILLTVIAVKLDKEIREYFIPITIGLTIISVLSISIEFQLFQIITEGFIGLAFFVVVMYAGAFNKTSKLSKKLRSVRKEYSIFGFILLIPHFYTYLISFLTGVMTWEWFGIVAMIIMIPLFITSFKIIKSKMDMKAWKKLQRYAYFAYAATFIHLILVAEPQESVVYFIIFGVYSVLKIRNYVLVKSSYRNIATFAIIAITALLIFINVSEVSMASSNATGIDYTSETLLDGTYSGSGTGFQSLEVEVQVVVENNKIVDIIILDCGCTSSHRGIDFEAAVDYIAQNVIDTQSTDVDTISGATKSTQGLIEAVEDALNEQ